MAEFSQEIQNRIIEEAKTWLKTPYCHGAAKKGVACDCCSLITGIYENVGLVPPGGFVRDKLLPDDWARFTKEEHMVSNVQKYFEPVDRTPLVGDLMFFRWRPTWPISHLGLSLGYPLFIHCNGRDGTQLSKLTERFWHKTWAGTLKWRFEANG